MRLETETSAVPLNWRRRSRSRLEIQKVMATPWLLLVPPLVRGTVEFFEVRVGAAEVIQQLFVILYERGKHLLHLCKLFL